MVLLHILGEINSRTVILGEINPGTFILVEMHTGTVILGELYPDTCLVHWEENLGCALIKSTLGPGNPGGGG